MFYTFYCFLFVVFVVSFSSLNLLVYLDLESFPLDSSFYILILSAKRAENLQDENRPLQPQAATASRAITSALLLNLLSTVILIVTFTFVQ